jgi:thiol-disulfide isomerase/thioredoxin
MLRSSTGICVLLAAWLLASPSCVPAQPAPSAGDKPAYNSDPKFVSSKSAAEVAAKMAQASTAPSERSSSETNQAEALYRLLGAKAKPDKLAPVETLLKSAIADRPSNVSARYMDGTVLAAMGRVDEARSAFSECLKVCSPKDPMYGRIQRFAEEPQLSTQRRAPAFKLTTLDGKRFSLDDMQGRVVLIDFWATWCGPCNEELPHIKRIAKDFANEPFVLVSISWDSDEAKWKSFIDKNQMTWPQYRDSNHALSSMFGIDAIPHYFTIDSDGVLTAEVIGSGNDVEGRVKKLIARAKAERAAMTADNQTPPVLAP